jgi:hypothetical protein
MSDDAFNVDDFMNMATEANDTVYPVGPAGTYLGVIEKIELPTGRTNKQNEPIYPLDITWEITDEKFRAAMGVEGDRKALVRGTVFLDLTMGSDGKKQIDTNKGKNVQLGKIREALGQNVPGWAPGRLVGAGPALLEITIDTGNDGVQRNRVKSVGKAA